MHGRLACGPSQLAHLPLSTFSCHCGQLGGAFLALPQLTWGQVGASLLLQLREEAAQSPVGGNCGACSLVKIRASRHLETLVTFLPA